MSRLVQVVMTKTQAEQMLWYIDRMHGTCYYGNKRQFQKREDDLARAIQKGLAKSEEANQS